MTKKQMGFYIPAIVLIVILGIVVLSFVGAFIDKNDIGLDIAFTGAVASIAAVVAALIGIAISIKEPDICISLGEKVITKPGNLRALTIKNEGNAMGNMASVFIDIEVNPSSPISFDGAEGLTFKQTTDTTRKQYRFDNPTDPMPLYPGKYIFHVLGFLENTSNVQSRIKLSVYVIGSQGRKEKSFKIDI